MIEYVFQITYFCILQIIYLKRHIPVYRQPMPGSLSPEVSCPMGGVLQAFASWGTKQTLLTLTEVPIQYTIGILET